MITLNELFSGIGAFRKAFERLNIEHKIIGISEIDKYAIQSYNAIYGETHNYGDISKLLKLDYADMWTYGFPCQDISVAGKQAGIKRGTRSGLLCQVQRLLEVSYQYNELPKYLILENVKNLVGKKFRADFDEWTSWLSELGYNTYWQVLNAKDYGVPQNRERVYAVSIKKELDNGQFVFPVKQELKLRLKDILEDKVDERYYLNNQQIHRIINSSFSQERRSIQEKDYCDTLMARDCNGPKCVRVGGIFDTENSRHQAGAVWDKEGISPTLDTMQGGWRQPSVIVDNGSGYISRKYNEFYDKNGYIPEMFNPYNSKEIIDIIPTQTANCGCATSSSAILKIDKLNNSRIRKLTPKECWRLMGFDDSDFEKAKESGVSNSQLYKQAGNSIVVNVLENILKNLFQ